MQPEQVLKDNHLKIVNCVKRDFPNRPMDIDDLIQEALMGFHLALTKMTLSKCSNIFSYCYQKAKWRCLDWIRRLDKEKKFREESSFEHIEKGCVNAVDKNVLPNSHQDESLGNENNFISHLEQSLPDNSIGNACNRLSQLELLEKTLDNYSFNQKQLLLLEFYGIKPDNSYKPVTINTVRRLKQRYKQEIFKLTGTG